MQYPEFFDRVERIRLSDELSEFLGVFEEGIIEFSYLDTVKLAGHSCPTVAGAYLMMREGLKALYGTTLPKRGEIVVAFQDGVESGTTGVIANIATQITGATNNSGFKGLNGHFNRTNLMHFNQALESSMRLTRIDTKQSVDLSYDPSSIASNPQVNELMKKMMQGIASEDEKKLFGILWQVRVQNILENFTELVSVKVIEE